MAVGDITASLAMTSRVLPILSLPSLPHAFSDRSQLWKLHVHAEHWTSNPVVTGSNPV